MGAQVVTAGLVDTAPAAQAAGELFARENVDLIVCYVGTYATSSQVLPAVQRRRAPVLVLNLQPAPALDYPNTDTGEWLANCSACCVPEISNAFAAQPDPVQRGERAARTGRRARRPLLRPRLGARSPTG